MSRAWFKNAVIYSVDVEKFLDSDSDGIGDFNGMIDRLDYLSGLGVDCVWLLPFYETPNRDNGYDVSDYYSVDPRLGDLGDFVEFMREADARGIRVMLDLVVNHTSSDHRWFQEARKSRDSKFRDFYVWADEPEEGKVEQIVFQHGEVPNPWDYDETAGQYYLHRFYEHQPDLNTADEIVRDEILKVMGFWLELGASGFRVDAAPYIGKKAAEAYDGDEHGFLKEMSGLVRSRVGNGVLLAEADVDPADLAPYFGDDDGNEMQLLLNFSLTNYLFLALARRSAEPVKHALDLLPDPPKNGQWANFLRNHDELDLERLTDEQRAEVYDAFAPQEEMRIYGRGIRRRLAPMLGGDQRRLRSAYSLLFSLPGTPVIRYGDEIGMGEDLSLTERESVRTVMQWSGEPHGGFSRAENAQELIAPAVSGGEFGYETVNVTDQRRDPESLLNWTERLIQVRKEASEIGVGSWEVIAGGDDRVLAMRYEYGDRVLICVHNLSGEEVAAKLEGCDDLNFTIDLFTDNDYEPMLEKHDFTMHPYGYRWMKGRTEDGSGRRAVGPERRPQR